jgi:hypothetical protein
MRDYNKGEIVMAMDPNQEQDPSSENPPQDASQPPHESYGSPENPYGEPQVPQTPPPQNPYGDGAPQVPDGSPPQVPNGSPPQNPYSAPQNPYRPPAQNPYAAAPYGDASYQGVPGYAPPQSAPLPLGEAIRNLPNQYLKVLTRPGAMTFAEEMGKASWDIVWVQLIAIAIISAILGYFSSLITTSYNLPSSSPISNAAVHAILAGVAFGYIILIPLFFFIGQGILFGLAKAFGGQGRFVVQSYTSLLYYVPIGIVTGIVGLIPYFGGIVVLAAGIYELVLSIFAIMAVHRLSGGRASAVVLIPIGVAVLLACGFIVVLVAIVAAAIQGR